MKPPQFDQDWSPEVVELFRNDLRQHWDPKIERHSWNQYWNQLHLYQSLVPRRDGLKILEIGCAQATLSLLLAEAGHRVWAADIRPSSLDYAATRHTHGEVHYVTTNVLADKGIGEEFDVIFANQIIEHLVYPGEFVERLVAQLAVGGKLIVTTPNSGYIKNKLPTYTELGDPAQWEQL